MYLNSDKNRVVNVDPWRYTTLSSLSMAIYLNCFLPDKAIAARDSNKPISKTSREWFIYMDEQNKNNNIDININREKMIDYSANISTDLVNIHTNKVGNNNTKQYYNKENHTFVVDGLCRKSKTIYEFNGCKYHGCQKCFPQYTELYNKTQERKNMLENLGYNVVDMWGCDWKERKKI